MPYQNFNPDEVDWKSLILKEPQHGGHFVGEHFQRGGNFGEANFAVSKLPAALVRSGLNTIADVAVGKNVVKSLEKNGKQVLDTVIGKGEKETAKKSHKRPSETVGILITPQKKNRRSLLTEQL